MSNEQNPSEDNPSDAGERETGASHTPENAKNPKPRKKSSGVLLAIALVTVAGGLLFLLLSASMCGSRSQGATQSAKVNLEQRLREIDRAIAEQSPAAAENGSPRGG